MMHILNQDAAEKLDALRTAAENAGIVLPEAPEFRAALKRTFSLSRFVAQTCMRDPELLADLVRTGDLSRTYPSGKYASSIEYELKALDAAGPRNPEEAGSDTRNRMSDLQHALRRIRKREMVRIAWRDLAGWAGLFETMADLSAFADACLEQSLIRLYRWACLKHGAPLTSEGKTQSLVVIGMGKLGGRELNFSSDIDLIFAYPENGMTRGPGPVITADDFFLRLARSLLACLGETTSDGLVFRIDMRLRPFGENGPLAMSFDQMEAYYQNQGRSWERYAWIKARIAAGDKKEGACLLERLKPFVYRRYLDFGTFESLRDMKQKVSLEVKRNNMLNNVKLGPGGIREIEFFGQIFQLIRGGVSPVLQRRRILKVLDILWRENIVPESVCRELTEAYVFLRNTEHRLQEHADRQTHDLPADPVKRARLAESMGFSGWDAFYAHLTLHMNRVHLHFNRLLEGKDDTASKTTTHDLLVDIWQDPADSVANKTLLADAGFQAPEEMLHLLKDLRNDPETEKLSRNGRNRLDQLVPIILEEVGKSRDQMRVLHRLVHLLRTIERRTCYLSLLLENPTVLKHLIRLATASSWIIAFLSRHPVLLDELIDPRTLYRPPDRSELEQELRRRLKSLPEAELEYRMESLRIFKQVNSLRVAAADISGTLPLMKVSDHLTFIAETLLEEVLEISWRHLVEKHGKPDCRLDDKPLDKGFAVIAYGKLGGFELGYSSDLDLVFLHAGAPDQSTAGPHPIHTAQFFARLGQRVIHILTMHTPAGILYETDMRLRPSGSSGLLVSHIQSFGEYQANQAWTWEHQALIRARPVCGDKKLAGRFEDIRASVLSRHRDPAVLQKEVFDMRRRLRLENERRDPGVFDLAQGVGGMVDIEFLVQYLVLLNAGTHPDLLKWTDNIRQLETLSAVGVIDDETASFLKDAYLAYRSAGHRQSLQEKPPVAGEDEFMDMRERVAALWRRFIGYE